MKAIFKLILISGLIMSHPVIAANLVCPNRYVYSGNTSSQAWPKYLGSHDTYYKRLIEGGYIDIHLTSDSVTINSIKNKGDIVKAYSSGNSFVEPGLNSVGTGYWRMKTDSNDRNYLYSRSDNFSLLQVVGYGPVSQLQFRAELRDKTGAIIKTDTISVSGKADPTTSWNIADVVFDDLATNQERSKTISGPTGNGVATLKKTKDSSYVTFKVNGTVPALNIAKTIPNGQSISLTASAGNTPGQGVATYTATLTCP
ncbi:hypothetical protein [Enterobacter wuhouensis]|uniref:hypothetical protein n=1 Tax=Enterobacter wuhouensis TaxID=2529381 RepID=UPI003D76D738